MRQAALDREAQQTQYASAAAQFGAALERLARGYEADAERRRDLLQDIHVALWRSFASFDGACSVRTWVYRVAHNVGATHTLRRRRHDVFSARSLDELAEAAAPENPEREAGDRHALARLLTLIRHLKPLDAEVMLLYLEDIDAAGIADITGLSAAAVATRIYRIKAVLARQFSEGGAMAAERDDLKTIWQTQPLDAAPMTIAEISRRAGNFQETVRSRNIVEYLAAAYVVGASGWNAWTAHNPLASLGFILLLLGAVFVAWQLRRRAAARRLPAQLPAQAYLVAYRDELSRQQHALRNVATWYLTPFTPGFVVILAARLLQQHPPHWLSALFMAGAIAILYTGIWLANINTANSLQHDIDQVDLMLGSNT